MSHDHDQLITGNRLAGASVGNGCIIALLSAVGLIATVGVARHDAVNVAASAGARRQGLVTGLRFLDGRRFLGVIPAFAFLTFPLQLITQRITLSNILTPLIFCFAARFLHDSVVNCAAEFA
ncbi:hypothetical protein [Mesorhizobium sp.]|uniref:hypothetical protein n=1 Tax=Mesorhizobium sp. TaxID=1871066 RepID=UPI000FE9E750|nr:hypothetical protein [Mesorhizobium sp.]RWK61581.1 MAG: hypothetical protein EOR49_17265 [Mesorhizobium sp.]RWM44867.1 MAG: hypothetical protein EOR76_22645 [Mesorhizobium sp.]RWM53526.1 MAG: hypothetical protein EOR78_19985 [Mesorhizobium sp.]RWM56920.1 MAG: hypothetical protein EOR79_17875 [Mesorhizobium sp.]RWM90130.1 MAG: hypothetical protein EOR85_31285 [Mesorhizobium sp.]